MLQNNRFGYIWAVSRAVHQTAGMRSAFEFPLLARNPLKLPGRYQDRASARLMAGNGWFPAAGEYMSDGMTNQADLTGFEVETMGESSGHCDCCGNESRRVWGMVHHQGGPSVAAYWMHWTVGHLSKPGANLDLVVGKWGDGTDAHDRFGVALVHRHLEDGTPSLMVVDADGRLSNVDLAATALKRCDVINTPLAEQVFSIVNAIYLQDGRFF